MLKVGVGKFEMELEEVQERRMVETEALMLEMSGTIETGRIGLEKLVSGVPREKLIYPGPHL